VQGREGSGNLALMSAPAADTGEGAAGDLRRARLALATGSLAFVLGTVNVTVTNVAFADIAASFPSASDAMVGWILTGYALAFASTMLVGGRLADRYGRLLIFRIGLFGLLASSLIAGLAPTIELLLIARAAQAICGALTVPSSLSLVLAQFPPSKQASVVGLWAAAGMVASGLSPGLAAIILEVGSWRWLYLVLVPIAGLGLIGSTRYMSETFERDLSKPLDLLGVGLGSGAVFFVVLATLQGRSWGWGSTATVACFALGVALLPAFLFRSNRHPEPLFDPKLFKIRSYAVANIAVSLSMVGALTSWFLWPYFLNGVWGYSKLGIGLAFTPSPIISGGVAVLGGRWADKHGFRGMLTVAAVIASGGGFWLWAFLDEDVEFWFAFFPATVFFGLGMGILASQLNSAALRDIPGQSIATANGVHQSLRYAIGGIGVAVALAVLGGTQDVARYDFLWLLLGALQILVVPVVWFGYPRGQKGSEAAASVLAPAPVAASAPPPEPALATSATAKRFEPGWDPAPDPRELLDSPRAWIVTIGGSIANGVAFGVLYTFGAFIQAMGDELDADLGPTALVFGITMFLFFGTGALSGRWSDRYGPSPLIFVGGLLFCGGLVATSFVNAIWQGYLVYGIGAGFGGGLFSAPLFAVTASWFVKHRSLAQGVAATGPGIGTLLLVPYAGYLIDGLGWRQSYRSLAVIAGVAFAVALLMVRRPPVQAAGDAGDHVRRVVRTRQFRLLTISGCCMSIALIGAFAFIITFAQAEGVSASGARWLVSIVGASSIIGRIAITGMANRLGSVRLLQMCLFTQPLAYLVWLLAGGNYGLLVVFAVILGISYGGFVALMGDVTAHLFGLVGIGAVLGLVYMASGVGSLIGPSMAGFLADASSGRTLPLATILAITIFGASVLSRLGTGPVHWGDPAPRLTAISTAQVHTAIAIPEAASTNGHGGDGHNGQNGLNGRVGNGRVGNGHGGNGVFIDLPAEESPRDGQPIV